MSEMQLKIEAYRRAMAVAKGMLRQGIISEKEYTKIDTMLAKKYGLSSSTIFR